jgi:putative oxygen-independent coproporphyrinogen III oxidase
MAAGWLEAHSPGLAASEAAPSEAAPPVALYVHVPFCVSLCPYCDFVVYTGAAARGPRARIDAFIEAVRTELALRADVLDDRFGPPAMRPALGSVYLGGGTPSLLPAGTVAALIDLVAERYGIAAGAEITLEANPGPDDRGDTVALAQAGVTRLSLGVQAMDEASLRHLGRRHGPRDVTNAVSAARAAGFGSVSVDLLLDVPGQATETFAEGIEAALALEPDHVSIYALTLDDPDAEGLTGPTGDHLPVRPGARRWRAAARTGQDEDRAATQYRLAIERLAAAGYRGYEISNWARPGHESRHNLAYWRRLPHEAVGPGAHAFDGAVRRWNAAQLAGYLAALVPAPGATAALPPGGATRLTHADADTEAAILGLRLDEGITTEAARRPPVAAHLDWARAAGLVQVDSDAGRVRLTVRGRLLSNELFARLV